MNNSERFLSKKITRREFLAGIGALATGCAVTVEPGRRTGSYTVTGGAIEEGAATAAQAVEQGIPTEEAMAAEAPVATAVPAAETQATEAMFEISGVPEQIDPGNRVLTVDVANADFGGDYINTLRQGTEMMFAEPGVLLVDSQFPQETIDESNGAIRRIDPLNQELFENATEAFPLNEGAFAVATMGYGTVEVDGARFVLEGQRDHMWLVAIRGNFEGDGDRNTTINFSEYEDGHAQAMAYPRGAFISEGNLKQIVDYGFVGDPNCGDSGCREGVSGLLYDVNTKALSVVRFGHDNTGQLTAQEAYRNW
ncbi:hypothetical protein HY468_00330 [Candidatus Roizmanbacteria bacterium]|nr:hypothetical protein [Candidatus Roizmanbacteria bacterium]